MSTVPLRTRVPSVCLNRLGAQGFPQSSQPLSDSISSPFLTPQIPSLLGFSGQSGGNSAWESRPRPVYASLERGAFSSVVLELSSGVRALFRKTSGSSQGNRVGRLNKG